MEDRDLKQAKLVTQDKRLRLLDTGSSVLVPLDNTGCCVFFLSALPMPVNTHTEDRWARDLCSASVRAVRHLYSAGLTFQDDFNQLLIFYCLGLRIHKQQIRRIVYFRQCQALCKVFYFSYLI